MSASSAPDDGAPPPSDPKPLPSDAVQSLAPATSEPAVPHIAALAAPNAAAPVATPASTAPESPPQHDQTSDVHKTSEPAAPSPSAQPNMTPGPSTAKDTPALVAEDGKKTSVAASQKNSVSAAQTATAAAQPAQLPPAPTSPPAATQAQLAPRPAAPPASQSVSTQQTGTKMDNSSARQVSQAAATPANAQEATGAAQTSEVKPTPASAPKVSTTSAPKPGSASTSKPAVLSPPKSAPHVASKPAASTAIAAATKATIAPAGALQRPSGSISLEIARMITDFLGPNYPRRDSVGATLNALRTRLETNTSMFDSDRETLIWQVREALRTEFFKIIYPAPPSPMLLSLVTRTEILLTDFHSQNRPFFFPGARVTVPTEAGSRRAGTALQLRFKVVGEATVTEALLHLDGPNGGGFQWVQTPALAPFVAYAPVQPSQAVARRLQQQRAITPRPKRGGKATARAPRPRAPRPPSAAKKKKEAAKAAAAKAAAAKAAAAASARAAAAAKKAQEPPPPPPPPAGPAALPPAYVPEALLSTSPPPRKRLRADVDRPLSYIAGSLRRALDVDASSGDMGHNSVGSIRRVIGVERLVARRKFSESGSIEYFVKWSGRSLREGSWEKREALMVDVPALVVDFDTRHPDKPKVACHSDREGTEKEEVEAVAKVEEKAEVKGNAEQKEEEEKELNGGAKVEAEDVKMEDVEEGIKQDVQPEPAKCVAETERKYVDEVTGIAIPGFLDTPILELGFAGMVLQVRRAGEWSLHNDAAAAARDCRKRQTRFKQEDIRAAEKLFPLSKSEAKTALDASLRSHKAHNRRPIPFPRGLGRAVPSDMGVPFSQEVLSAAPPSWESYLLGLGLRPKHLERELPPLMPTLDMKTTRRVAAMAKDAAFERAVEHRERARRVVRAAYRHGINAEAPASLFREGVRRPVECDTCFPTESNAAMKKNKSPRVPEPATNGLFRMRDAGFGAALAAATARSKAVKDKEGQEERWFDPVWSCWRVGRGGSVQ